MQKKVKVDWNLVHLAPKEKRERIDAELEEIKRKRGQIITWSLEVEELLEGILTNFFMRNDSKKAKIFEVEMMRRMKFDAKVQLFEKVLLEEGYDKEKRKKIKISIGNLQKARTKAAHWRILVFLQKGEVRLRERNELLEQETISLSDDMLKKLEEDKEYLLQEIIRFYRWSWDKEIKDLNERLKKRENTP